jgi:hypothetical protein
MKLANNTKDIGVAVSCDDNDPSMLRNLVQEEIVRTLLPAGWSKLFFSPNKSKIQACNANMNEIDWNWDIVVLVSDDMVALGATRRGASRLDPRRVLLRSEKGVGCR